MLRRYMLQILPCISFGLLALAIFGSTAKGADSGIAQRIQRGERFLARLFDDSLQLLPEYKGSSTY